MGMVKKFKDKLNMYDMILANLYAGKAIIEPSEPLNDSQIHIGFSNIASESQISKYFCINGYPDYIKEQLGNDIRTKCMESGVKLNFYYHCMPYKINWDSADMRNKMSIWKQYSQENSSSVNVFEYRTDAEKARTRDRIIQSTRYLNEAELEYKRALTRVSIVIEISARRDKDSIVNMAKSVKKLKEYCSTSGIRLRELRINMMDWIKAVNPFALNASKETNSKIIKKVMTDDNLANFSSYRQGLVGLEGTPIGIDVLSYCVVLRKFKSDPDKAENWLVSAETGGGKSLWVKSLITYFLGEDYTVVVMDYEGDEYTNYANFVRDADPADVKVVSMGKGSTVYFDPCEIPELTGDPEVDNDLKESSIGFIEAVFRVIVHGMEGEFSIEEKKVLSTAIQRMYDSAGVTDDKYTWKRSKGLRLHDVFHELKEMVITKELVDSDDNTKHLAASYIVDSSSMFFEEGGAKATMFSKPMSANELYKAKFIVFSFGMKGASESTSDPTMLALKQLSVAYININISNYCKYIRHTFNVKIWEEFQRYGEAKGSAEIISNVITGGRKRGDINFIITNDLGAMLSEDNPLAVKILDNIQNYSIGKIKSRKTREKFCTRFDLQDCLGALNTIAKANMEVKNVQHKRTSSKNKYKHSFCVIMDDGNKTIVKSMLPPSVLKSSLFSTGVQIE